MKLSLNRVRALCDKRRIGIGEALQRAGVSRNAFYTLARKPSVIPNSVSAVAAALNVSPAALLEAEPNAAERARIQAVRAAELAARDDDADADNIRHTMILLDEPPVARLRRALRRGRQLNLR